MAHLITPITPGLRVRIEQLILTTLSQEAAVSGCVRIPDRGDGAVSTPHSHDDPLPAASLRAL